jgi:transcriptional regulator with XRE-family HTH domain
MKKKPTTFGAKVAKLRKEQGWSQPRLGKMIGTSGAIIGRYERSEITPSIEVARKLADAFGVTVDSLVNERDLPGILSDQEMLQRWKALADLDQEDREKILYLVDGLIRDAKARQAYSVAS